MVSNHGGRQLDGCSATAEVLRECVEAVAGTGIEVYIDGGVRRGKDVMRALSLGATAVFIGRPVLHGLVVGGEQGVHSVLSILHEELLTTMALCGCETTGDISTSHTAVRFGLAPSRL